MQGQFVYGIEGRGGGVRLVYGPTERFADSDCVSCGACVEVCPTGAIGDRDRVPHAPIATEATESVCGYCGVGCRLGIETDQGVILRIGGIGNAAVNRGHLCVKGRYAHAFVARRLLEVRDAHGSDALGTMTSSRSTNEAAYLLQKLFRGIIGTNNVDCCARVCHASTAVALGMVTGTGAATASYDDIERASTQPYALTGYMKLGDPSVQERLEREWGAAPPTEAGKTIPEMHDAADAANLFIQGTPALKEYDAA